MSAGLGGGKLVLLVGAGAVGSVIWNNPYLGGVFKDVAQVLVKHLRDGAAQGRKEEGAQSSEDTATLSAQVKRLSQELRNLASMRSTPVVIAQGSHGGGGHSVMSLVVPVALLGTVEYGYMWWHNIKLGDLMYATRKGVQQALDNCNSQMERLTTALSSAKRQLNGKVEAVSKSLSESLQLQQGIKKDVSDMHVEVSELGGDIKCLRGSAALLEGKVDHIQRSCLVAAQGVLMLLNVVSGNNLLPGAGPEFRQVGCPPSSPPLPLLQRSPAGSTLGGLKEFQGLVAELEGSKRLLTDGGGHSALPMIGLSAYDGDLGHVGPALLHRSMSASSRLGCSTECAAAAAAAAALAQRAEGVFEQAPVQIRHVAEEGDTWTQPFGNAQGDSQGEASAGQEQHWEHYHAPIPTLSSFTEDDLSFPPRNPRFTAARLPGHVAPHSAGQRTGLTSSHSAHSQRMPPVNRSLF